MSIPGDEGGSEVDETVVVSRRARRRAADHPEAAVPSDDEFAHEATVVVDRSRPTDAPTADAPADDEFAHEATVVVDRSRPADAPTADATADDEFAHEATVVVDRSQPAAEPASDESGNDGPADPDADGAVEDRTVAIDRSRPSGTGSVGQSAEASPDEATVAVPRRGRRLLRRRSPAPADSDGTFDDEFPADTVPRSTTSFERPAGLSNPAIYKPRPAPLVPSAPPVQVQGASAPTRTLDPARPSVAKGAVRESRLTLAAFVGACVVSVAGLTGLVFLIIG